jgi:hypothetical protein
MKVSSARKATGMAAAAIAILALAAGSAFAGTSHSNGGGADTGNKYGTGENKPVRGCGNGWELVAEDQNTWVYDLNGDDQVCQTWTSSGYDYTDNSSTH